MLTPDDIANLADLARLDLGAEEKINLQKDLEAALDGLSVLTEVPEVVEDRQPEDYYPRNVMRADDCPYEAGTNTEKILEEAPKRRDNLFAVKKILDN